MRDTYEWVMNRKHYWNNGVNYWSSVHSRMIIQYKRFMEKEYEENCTSSQISHKTNANINMLQHFSWSLFINFGWASRKLDKSGPLRQKKSVGIGLINGQTMADTFSFSLNWMVCKWLKICHCIFHTKNISTLIHIF